MRHLRHWRFSSRRRGSGPAHGGPNPLVRFATFLPYEGEETCCDICDSPLGLLSQMSQRTRATNVAKCRKCRKCRNTALSWGLWALGNPVSTRRAGEWGIKRSGFHPKRQNPPASPRHKPSPSLQRPPALGHPARPLVDSEHALARVTEALVEQVDVVAALGQV